MCTFQKYPVITLCGSTRYPDLFVECARRLTLAGAIVISVGLFGHQEGMDMSGNVKKRLDRMHFAKIAMSDGIFVLNPNGRIGLSTMDGTLLAMSSGRLVFFMEEPRCAGDWESLILSEGCQPIFKKGKMAAIMPDYAAHPKNGLEKIVAERMAKIAGTILDTI